MQQPTKRNVQFAFGAAAAFSLAAIIGAVIALTRGPAWQLWSAIGFGGVATLWWVVAMTWNRRAS